MKPRGIGIAVISYHSTKDLRLFLQSFNASDVSVPVKLTVSLVDCDEIELKDTLQLIRSFHLEDVSVVVPYQGQNVGYGRACNDAATLWDEEPTLRTYAFFNADTELRPGVLEGCDALLWSRPDYGVVGPRQVDRQGLITHAGIVGPPPRHRAFKTPGRDHQYTEILDDCWSVMGSAYFTRAPLWWELTNCSMYREVMPYAPGAFLETPHFYEDEFYSRHAVAHGRKVVYDGKHTMVHQQGGATPANGWAQMMIQKSRPIYEAACAAHGFAAA